MIAPAENGHAFFAPYAPPRRVDLPIAVVIPVYNGAAFIASAIRSVRMQSVPAAEILVIDDASSDTTREIVARMAEDDRRIRLICNTTNRGPSFSRNRGLSEAGGALVAFLDADDIWLPDHLANITTAFRAHPTATVAFAHVCSPSSTADTPYRIAEAEMLRDPLLDFLVDNPVPQSAAAVRPGHILEAGGYREDMRYAEDYELWMRLVHRNATFAHVPRATVMRVTHAAQVSLNGSEHMHRSAWSTRRAIVEARYGSADRAEPAVVQRLLHSEALCIAEAFNARRKDLVRVMLEATSWIPASHTRHARVERLLHWQWPFWRAAAFAYDHIPDVARRWVRAHRRRLA